jgi:hypothetical protein
MDGHIVLLDSCLLLEELLTSSFQLVATMFPGTFLFFSAQQSYMYEDHLFGFSGHDGWRLITF